MAKQHVVGCGVVPLVLVFVAAMVFVFVLGDEGTPLHPSDLSEWRQIEAESLPVVAKVALDKSTHQIDIAWAPDSSALSWIERRAAEDSVRVLHFDDKSVTTLDFGRRASASMHQWASDTRQIQLGVYSDADLDRPIYERVLIRDQLDPSEPTKLEPISFSVPVPALEFFDARTGVKESTHRAEDVLHSIAPQADGTRLRALLFDARPRPQSTDLLVRIQAYTSTNPLRQIDPPRIGLLNADGTGRKLPLHSESAWTYEFWTNDGSGLTSIYLSSLGWKVPLSSIHTPMKSSVYHRYLDTPEDIDTVATIGTTSLAMETYPDDGGILRYIGPAPKAFRREWECRLMEYHMGTRANRTVSDLKALFTPLYAILRPINAQRFPSKNSNRLLLDVNNDFWLVQLAPERVIVKLPFNEKFRSFMAISPDGKKLALATTDRILRVYDLDSALEQSGD
jgi:hypothetical protein